MAFRVEEADALFCPGKPGQDGPAGSRPKVEREVEAMPADEGKKLPLVAKLAQG